MYLTFCRKQHDTGPAPGKCWLDVRDVQPTFSRRWACALRLRACWLRLHCLPAGRVKAPPSTYIYVLIIFREPATLTAGPAATSGRLIKNAQSLLAENREPRAIVYQKKMTDSLSQGSLLPSSNNPPPNIFSRTTTGHLEHVWGHVGDIKLTIHFHIRD